MMRSRPWHRAVSRFFTVWTLACLMMMGTLTPFTFAAPGAAAANAVPTAIIYDDALAQGWYDWSWGSTVDFGRWSAYGGAQSIGWQINAPWSGLYLHTDFPIATTQEASLRFAVRSLQPDTTLWLGLFGTNNAYLGGVNLAEIGGAPQAWQWQVYEVPLSRFGAGGQAFTGFFLQEGGGATPALVEVDEIALVGSVPPPPIEGTACGGIPNYREVRPANTTQNQTWGRPTNPEAFFGHPNWRPYYERIDGACTGSTEQILEWAAKKWGFDQLGYPDLAKAMAVVETWWYQSHVGYNGEVGILQVRDVWPDWEFSRYSTAYAADYAMAVVRSHYDGASWLGDATKGNLRDSVAAWECGCPGNGWNWYANRVFEYYDTKPWQRPGLPPEWFYRPVPLVARVEL